jgi:hypothetical protein
MEEKGPLCSVPTQKESPEEGGQNRVRVSKNICHESFHENQEEPQNSQELSVRSVRLSEAMEGSLTQPLCSHLRHLPESKASWLTHHILSSGDVRLPDMF